MNNSIQVCCQTVTFALMNDNQTEDCDIVPCNASNSNDRVKFDRFGRIKKSYNDKIKYKYDSDSSVSSCSSYYWLGQPKYGRRAHSLSPSPQSPIATTVAENGDTAETGHITGTTAQIRDSFHENTKKNKKTKKKRNHQKPNFNFSHNYVDIDNLQPCIDDITNIYSCVDFYGLQYGNNDNIDKNEQNNTNIELSLSPSYQPTSPMYIPDGSPVEPTSLSLSSLLPAAQAEANASEMVTIPTNIAIESRPLASRSPSSSPAPTVCLSWKSNGETISSIESIESVESASDVTLMKSRSPTPICEWEGKEQIKDRMEKYVAWAREEKRLRVGKYKLEKEQERKNKNKNKTKKKKKKGQKKQRKRLFFPHRIWFLKYKDRRVREEQKTRRYWSRSRSRSRDRRMIEHFSKLHRGSHILNKLNNNKNDSKIDVQRGNLKKLRKNRTYRGNKRKHRHNRQNKKKQRIEYIKKQIESTNGEILNDVSFQTDLQWLERHHINLNQFLGDKFVNMIENMNENEDKNKNTNKNGSDRMVGKRKRKRKKKRKKRKRKRGNILEQESELGFDHELAMEDGDNEYMEMPPRKRRKIGKEFSNKAKSKSGEMTNSNVNNGDGVNGKRYHYNNESLVLQYWDDWEKLRKKLSRTYYFENLLLKFKTDNEICQLKEKKLQKLEEIGKSRAKAMIENLDENKETEFDVDSFIWRWQAGLIQAWIVESSKVESDEEGEVSEEDENENDQDEENKKKKQKKKEAKLKAKNKKEKKKQLLKNAVMLRREQEDVTDGDLNEMNNRAIDYGMDLWVGDDEDHHQHDNQDKMIVKQMETGVVLNTQTEAGTSLDDCDVIDVIGSSGSEKSLDRIDETTNNCEIVDYGLEIAIVPTHKEVTNKIDSLEMINNEHNEHSEHNEDEKNTKQIENNEVDNDDETIEDVSLVKDVSLKPEMEMNQEIVKPENMVNDDNDTVVVDVNIGQEIDENEVLVGEGPMLFFGLTSNLNGNDDSSESSDDDGDSETDSGDDSDSDRKSGSENGNHMENKNINENNISTANKNKNENECSLSTETEKTTSGKNERKDKEENLNDNDTGDETANSDDGSHVTNDCPIIKTLGTDVSISNNGLAAQFVRIETNLVNPNEKKPKEESDIDKNIQAEINSVNSKEDNKSNKSNNESSETDDDSSDSSDDSEDEEEEEESTSESPKLIIIDAPINLEMIEQTMKQQEKDDVVNENESISVSNAIVVKQEKMEEAKLKNSLFGGEEMKLNDNMLISTNDNAIENMTESVYCDQINNNEKVDLTRRKEKIDLELRESLFRLQTSLGWKKKKKSRWDEKKLHSEKPEVREKINSILKQKPFIHPSRENTSTNNNNKSVSVGNGKNNAIQSESTTNEIVPGTNDDGNNVDDDSVRVVKVFDDAEKKKRIISVVGMAEPQRITSSSSSDKDCNGKAEIEDDDDEEEEDEDIDIDIGSGIGNHNGRDGDDNCVNISADFADVELSDTDLKMGHFTSEKEKQEFVEKQWKIHPSYSFELPNMKQMDYCYQSHWKYTNTYPTKNGNIANTTNRLINENSKRIARQNHVEFSIPKSNYYKQRFFGLECDDKTTNSNNIENYDRNDTLPDELKMAILNLKQSKNEEFENDNNLQLNHNENTNKEKTANIEQAYQYDSINVDNMIATQDLAAAVAASYSFFPLPTIIPTFESNTSVIKLDLPWYNIETGEYDRKEITLKSKEYCEYQTKLKTQLSQMIEKKEKAKIESQLSLKRERAKLELMAVLNMAPTKKIETKKDEKKSDSFPDPKSKSTSTSKSNSLSTSLSQSFSKSNSRSLTLSNREYNKRYHDTPVTIEDKTDESEEGEIVSENDRSFTYHDNDDYNWSENRNENENNQEKTTMSIEDKAMEYEKESKEIRRKKEKKNQGSQLWFPPPRSQLNLDNLPKFAREMYENNSNSNDGNELTIKTSLTRAELESQLQDKSSYTRRRRRYVSDESSDTYDRYSDIYNDRYDSDHHDKRDRRYSRVDGNFNENRRRRRRGRKRGRKRSRGGGGRYRMNRKRRERRYKRFDKRNEFENTKARIIFEKKRAKERLKRLARREEIRLKVSKKVHDNESARLFEFHRKQLKYNGEDGQIIDNELIDKERKLLHNVDDLTRDYSSVESFEIDPGFISVSSVSTPSEPQSDECQQEIEKIRKRREYHYRVRKEKQERRQQREREQQLQQDEEERHDQLQRATYYKQRNDSRESSYDKYQSDRSSRFT